MVTHWKHLNYWLSVIFWFRAAQYVLLAVSKMSKSSKELSSTQCKTSIQSIILSSLWLRDNFLKTKTWKVKIGIDSYLSSNKSKLTRRRKLKNKRNNTIHSHQNNNQDYKISKWKQVNISSVRKKSIKEKCKWKRRNNKRRRNKKNNNKHKRNIKIMKKLNFKKKNNVKSKETKNQHNLNVLNQQSMNSKISSCQNQSRKLSFEQN